MSGGQLELHGQVADWDGIKTYLLESDIPTKLTNNDYEDDWSSTNWGWESEEAERDKKNTGTVTDSRSSWTFDKKSISWLDECVIAHSPNGDVLAIAKGSRAIFLASECDIGTNRVKYFEGFKGKLNEEEGEFITSIACLPLISQKRSSPGAPDWTCIIVGFNRGHVRVYTESGILLVSQQLHNERVLNFKVRSFTPSRVQLQHDQLEELVVIYRTVVVTLEGFGLFQMLRACRNHFARLKANAAESTIDPPYLVHKKWSYETEQTVSDCEMIGLNTPSAFDHLVTASILGGFNAKPNQNPPTACIFSSIGQNPYLAYHHAQESQAPPVLSEVAYAVASKVKSSILNAATGWLGFGGSSTSSATKPNVKETRIEAPTSMSFRTGLTDVRRDGKSILCSPRRNLSVVTDGLGRVTLIDNSLGIAVRMWKGYRDAQCSWISVDEQSSSRKAKGAEPRSALFLVIYAPRRERLEVYAMQQGPKVASFEVNKHGRLLSTTFGMMGLNNVHTRGGNKPPVPSLFLDCAGNVFTFNIPFHLALSDKGSSKVKDMHLLKALQKLVRDGQFTSTSLLEILVEVRTQSMINQGFRILTQKCGKVEVLAEVLHAYSQKFCDTDEKDLTVVFQLISMLELFEFLVASNAQPPAYVENQDESKDDRSLLFCLHASEKEMSILEKMAQDDLECKQPKSKSVTFEADSGVWSLTSFFACFEIEFDPNKIKASAAGNSPSTVTVNFKYEEIDKLGELLFCGCLNGTTDLEDWKQKLKSAGLNAGTILLLALQYWCRNSVLSSSYVGLMEKIYHVVKAICDLEGHTSVISDFNQVSKWWEEIRKEIISSPQIFPVYSFSIACRGVAIDLQHQRQTESFSSKEEMFRAEANNGLSGEDTEGDNGGPSTSSSVLIDSEFENMSLDLLKWNILLKQIEDLSLLSSILVQKPQLDHPQLPVLKGHSESLTVIKLLDKGKGCIAELVGRWLTTIGIDPQLITDAIEDEVTMVVNSSAATTTSPKGVKESVHADEIDCGEEAVEAEKSTNHVLDLLRCLRGNFSVSLSSSIILSNYCWEYCLEWKNETNNVEYLGAAVKCAGAIPSPLIRQGMISMIWNIFVSKKLLGVTAISKTTREKLADRTGGFSTHDKKLEFLNYSVQFLDLFMETNIVCDGCPLPTNPILKNHWSSEANSNASLTDLALLQPLPNFDLILLNYQLALCAHLFYTFRIKGTMKPTNLFDTKSRMLLSQSVQNPAPFSQAEVDFGLKILREEFLCLAMSGAVRAIPESQSAIHSRRPRESQSVVPCDVGIKECENWINKCIELGRLWRLELDGLRISYVCELYSSGLDYLGLEAIATVYGRDILGTKLLLIAGMRLSYLINQRRENVTEIISSFSTNLSKWLDSLEYTVLRSLRFSRNSIPDLLIQVLQLIPESSYDYKLAAELLQASNWS